MDEHPPGVGGEVRGDAPAGAERATGPHLARFEGDGLGAQHRRDAFERRGVDVRRQRLGQVAQADRALAAVGGLGVVEGRAQKLHEALGAGDVAAHDVGLALPRRDDARVVLLVEAPLDAGGAPAVGGALDDAVDGELLEQQLDPVASQARLRVEGHDAHRLGRGLQCGQERRDLLLLRDRRRREVLPDVLVARGGQQRDDGRVDGTARTPDVLVVRHR